MKYELKQLRINDGEDIYQMLQEIPYDENGFLNSVNGKSYEEYKRWLVRDDEISKAIGLEDWMVPSATYWLYADGYPVGLAKLRYCLTDRLRKEGGHIGYAIRPGERGKGYGTVLLKMVLEEAKKLNIDKVLITVKNYNTASIKVAVKNGGCIEKVSDERHYIWIDVNQEKVIRQWNQWSDDEWYVKKRTDDIIANLVKHPESAFHPKALEVLKSYFPELRGRKICVPASGDNHAAFAFALMGAEVTSADISIRQIENAKAVAERLGLPIRFICEDSLSFMTPESNYFDLVYTSNGVNVWINDPVKMYSNFRRVLKDNGLYILYDVHPFTRPFNKESKEAVIMKPYSSIGPFDEPDQYHWRVQDFLNCLIRAGFTLEQMQELYAQYGTYWFDIGEELPENAADYYDWHKNPQAALPQWLLLVSRKQCRGEHKNEI